jgi:hypothetical protein
MPTIDLLTFPDAGFSMLATAADTLGVANALASMQAGKRARQGDNRANAPAFGWRLIARDPARWRAAAGTLACRCEALPADDSALGDALIVPPLHFDHIGTLEQRLALLELERATIRRYLEAGRLVASPFTGVAMLADVLPPGQRLTVTWLIAGWLQGNFPHLKPAPAQAIVSSGNVITARAMEHGVALVHRVVGRLRHGWHARWPMPCSTIRRAARPSASGCAASLPSATAWCCARGATCSSICTSRSTWASWPPPPRPASARYCGISRKRWGRRRCNCCTGCAWSAPVTCWKSAR